MLTDTIAAISTSGINSGINIIRISGKESREIVSRLFSNSNKLEHQKIIYGKLTSIRGNILDEVLVSYFKAPNSFTGEDVCEINCHGGRKITAQILKEILSLGASLAEPGEFSKRAFLNGKMDLSKAEAVIDIINSKTEMQTKIAASMLGGKLSEKIETTREILIELLAQIEVSIDYPEYDYEEITEEELTKKINMAIYNIEALLADYESGKYLKEGVSVALIGATNAGKSSLMNALAEEEKSIVTDVEGTTRDVIEHTIVINDIILKIHDTAGIRKTTDIVEKIGVEKSINTSKEADLVIYILDSTKDLPEEEIEFIRKIKEEGKKIIICINKIDLSHEKKQSVEKAKEGLKSVEISAVTGEGIDELKKEIVGLFELDNKEEEQERLVVNERQKELLTLSKEYIEVARKGVQEKQDIELIAINIKEAAEKLGNITGENASEDVVNKIFEKFCLGK